MGLLYSASWDEFNLQILLHFVYNIWVSLIRPASFSRRWPLGYALCFWRLDLKSLVASLLGSITFALQISFHSFSANVIDSTNKFQYASLLKLGSHYPLLRGIIRPASFSALCFWSLGLIKFVYTIPCSAFACGSVTNQMLHSRAWQLLLSILSFFAKLFQSLFFRFSPTPHSSQFPCP